MPGDVGANGPKATPKDERKGPRVSNANSAVERILIWVCTVGVAASLAWVVGIERRVTTIEATRFTLQHSIEMEQRIFVRMEAMGSVIADLPPEDFKLRVEKMEAQLHSMELHLARKDGYVSPQEGGP